LEGDKSLEGKDLQRKDMASLKKGKGGRAVGGENIVMEKNIVTHKMGNNGKKKDT